ncbi:MAG: RluA family pseudouridine synthase [Puniceicoccaceae bacterium]
MEERSDQDLQVVVPDGTRAERADKMLARLYPELSRSRWQKLFQDGRVWQDDRVLAQKHKLRAGDVVDFSIPPVEPLELLPVEMDLDVVYEDDDLLVLNKAPGVVVHPGAGTGNDTLVHGILHHCKGQLSGIGGKERPGIVHRLDKETSGVLVVAKSDAAFQGMAEQFAERSIEKFYTALVKGVPHENSGQIEEPIGRHPVHRVRMACRKEGRHALTDYRVFKHWGNLASKLDLQIHTGRTHQIRVHLKHLGCPVLGDVLYGYKSQAFVEGKPVDLPAIPRIMLHAARLRFNHPVNGEEMQLEASLPDDMQQVADELEAFIGQLKPLT